MTPVEKSAAVAVALPVVTAFSPAHGIAMGFGLLGGFMARVGVSRRARKTWPEIGSEAIVMLLMLGGSIITTLIFARLTRADELSIAAIAFVVTFMGDDAFQTLKKFVLAPILAAIRKHEEPDDRS